MQENREGESAREEVRQPLPHLRLTTRDYDIFLFLLDQGFATLEAVYFKFFDTRLVVTDPFPKNLEVTRQRLRLLEKHGFLSTQKVHTESKSLFLLARKGFQALHLKKPPLYAPPLKAVDFRYYEHDRAVTYCRLALERSQKSWDWMSERKIRFLGYSRNGHALPKTLIPDGIFTNSKGEKVAFELESARKARGRYQQKIYDYSQSIQNGLFQKVLYVIHRDDVASELAKAVHYQTGIQLERYSHFTGVLDPNRELGGFR